MTECTISFESQVMKLYIWCLCIGFWTDNEFFFLFRNVYILEMHSTSACPPSIFYFRYSRKIFYREKNVLSLLVFLAYYCNTNILGNSNQTGLVSTSPTFPLLPSCELYDSNCSSPRKLFLGNFSAKCFYYVPNVWNTFKGYTSFNSK